MTNIFIPIQKIDEERREVWGYGSREEPDQAGEIMDFETSRPYFERWTEVSKARSGGKSMGNVRSMHSNIAAGKLISFQSDPATKGFYVGAHVVDDNEWKKVRAGVYTGFSIGGSYVKRWPDRGRPGLMRYTADPKELSLVDAPCLPGATFDMVKADGIVKVAFTPTGENVSVPIEVEEGGDLEKALPGVPEPVATVAAGEKPQGPFQVEQVPNQFSPVEIKPGSEPEQTVLQTHAVPSKDISAEFDKWIPKLQQLIKEAVAEALEKAGWDESKHPRDGGKFSAGEGGSDEDKLAEEQALEDEGGASRQPIEQSPPYERTKGQENERYVPKPKSKEQPFVQRRKGETNEQFDSRVSMADRVEQNDPSYARALREHWQPPQNYGKVIKVIRGTPAPVTDNLIKVVRSKGND